MPQYIIIPGDSLTFGYLYSCIWTARTLSGRLFVRRGERLRLAQCLRNFDGPEVQVPPLLSSVQRHQGTIFAARKQSFTDLLAWRSRSQHPLTFAAVVFDGG
jgi:hypothetical protein